MFDAMLKKDNDPLSAAEIVEFPIPEAQYEKTIRALNGIQSGAVVEQDCFVADIGTADCPALERLIGTMANVDELDWLGKQLESFDRYELLQFNAAVERFGLSAADELIDLSFCATFLRICPGSALGVIGVQQRNKVGCLRLGKLCFCFGNPIKQESDFLLDVPDNGIGGFDPAVELALLGAYAFLLHCPDGCALMDGGKKLHALTLIASVVDTNVKPFFRKLGVA